MINFGLNMTLVQVVNQSPHPLPQYQTAGAAGMDVLAWLPEPVRLDPGQRALIPTGLYLAIPQGYEIQIRPRSGLSLRTGITVINAPGTIDADYRGEIKVPLVHLGDQVQWIRDGDRVAQMVLAPVARIQWEITDQLSPTERGEAGFGSTGGFATLDQP